MGIISLQTLRQLSIKLHSQAQMNISRMRLLHTCTPYRYQHFDVGKPHDYWLPIETMPKDVDALMKTDPSQMDYFGNYWYWRIRGESTLMDSENLPKKTYKQLTRDLGMQVVSEESEHMLGLLELYEYLKSSPFVGPFGTIKNPVLVPSMNVERVVGCTGGTGDREHVPLWFRCREGFLYRCGECDQIFMLVRVLLSLPDGEEPFPIDPDIDDVFNPQVLERGHVHWNTGDYIFWPVGNATYKQLFLQGKWGNPVPDTGEFDKPEDHPSSLKALEKQKKFAQY